MRNKIFIIILALLLLASPVLAADKTRTSGENTADAAITTDPGKFRGILVATDGTNEVEVSIYDNASAASGTELIPTTVITTSDTNRAQGIFLPFEVEYKNGIYVDVTLGAGTVGYVVYYQNK
ncbi:MAG: hypothetical protein GY820_16990 [Gammaproteobacteria bacterium]|nr:hypothetical protein [Gammaproteobacteria bacterium]